MPDLPAAVIAALEAADIPPMPQVLHRLLKAVEDRNVTIPELSAIVEKDAALAARVLAAANSPAFFRGRPIASIADSLQTLGIRVIKSIAVSLAVKRLFDQKTRHWNGDLSRYWAHCLFAAELARSLAAAVAPDHTDEAYIAGLLHDIGVVLLASAMREPYADLLRNSRDENALIGIERQHVPADHAGVGSWLVDRWQLDSSISDSIFFHHEPIERIAGADALCRLVWVASACVDGFPAVDAACGPFEQLLQGDPAALPAMVGEAHQRMLSIAASLNIPVSDDAGSAGFLPLDIRFDTRSHAEADEDMALAIAGRAVLQPLQEVFRQPDSEEELLLLLRETARILLGVDRLVFLFVDGLGQALRGAHTASQPTTLRSFEEPLAAAASLAAQAITTAEMKWSWDAAGDGGLSLADVQLRRALASEGFVCLPLLAAGRPLGAMVLGVSTDQQARLRDAAEWLRIFGALAAEALASRREFAERVERAEVSATSRHHEQARRSAHEAGNPLAIIKSYLKLIEGKVPESADLGSELAVLREEIDRVRAIVQNLGRHQAAPAAADGTDLNATLRELASLYAEALFQSRKIGFTLDLDPQQPIVEAHRDPIKQIFLNLLKNAAEAMTAGRIDVETRADVYAEGRYWAELLISDTGPGLPREGQRRLQAAGSALPPADPGGRGLGLSIVADLVKQCNARISSRVRPGKGTEVSIRFPSQPAQPLRSSVSGA